jgi:hypothetical protein
MASGVSLADHRARHYYLVSICRRLLRDGVPLDKVPAVFAADRAAVESWFALRSVPPSYVVPLGAVAYRIAPPAFPWYDRPLFWCQVKLPKLLAASIARRSNP